MTIREYGIRNLDCAGCSAKIEGEIANLAEVSSVNLDFINKRLVIQYHKEGVGSLERLNQIATRIEPGVKIFSPEDAIEPKRSVYSKVIYVGLALWLAVQILPLPAAWEPWLMIIAYLLIGGRVLHSAVKEVFSRQLMAEHFLMSIASLGAIYLGEFTEAIAVIALYELGQYLEARAVDKSKRAVMGIMSLKPEIAHVKTDSGIIDTRLNLIKPGDVLVVNPGERIPLDGRITKGQSSLDTSSVSGESTPLAVSTGDDVFSGCLNQSGLLELEVSKPESESMVAKIISLIENASARKSHQERFITRFARIYTPVVVALAILVFLLPVILGYSAEIWFKRALVFLIVSCPCALVISIPLTYYIGIGMAARKGIIFKGSVFLDGLRKSTQIVFDKTGTLTTGSLTLNALHPVAGISESELGEALWLAEYNSGHPFAMAVKQALNFEIQHDRIESYTEIPGKGIHMIYNNKLYLTGSQKYLAEAGFQDFCDIGENSGIHIARDGLYLGAASFSDEIKPNMLSALSKLRKSGVKRLFMLSGDRFAKANAVSRELELDGFVAELLPGDKLNGLEDIMQRDSGKTVYVGDGMNDAPVLARADIGIAMGAIGAQASIDSADIVLLNDKPEQLVEAFRISKAINSKVWQNIILALGIKILVMSLGVAGISGLWEAIIADVGVTLLVISNSLSLGRYHSGLDKNPVPVSLER